MAANGVGVTTQITLAGSPALTLVAGHVYKITLAKDATVTLTPTFKDIAGNDPTYTGTVHWVSRETGQATVGAATGATCTVTAVAKGEAHIECFVPAFDDDGVNNTNYGKVYAEVIVTVTA